MRRGIVLAFIILSAAPDARARAQQNSAESNQLQTAVQQPSNYYGPCQGDQNDYNSDLCAQWTSAKWTKWSFWAALVAAIGVVITLVFNLAAWRQARRAEEDTETALTHAGTSASAAARLAEHAEKTARAELRAYLDFDGVYFMRDESKDTSEAVGTGISIKLKNYGKTPANEIKMATVYLITSPHLDDPKKVAIDTDKKFSHIAPSDEATSEGEFLMPRMVWEAIEQRLATMQVFVEVDYVDYLNEPCTLDCVFESRGTAKHFSFVSGTRHAT